MSSSKLRSVGRLEKFATARHSLDFYHNVAVSAFYSHTSSTPINELQHFQCIIYEALKRVIADNPALGVTILDEDKSKPYFSQLPAINLAKTVTFVSSKTIPNPTSPGAAKELDEILEEQHNRNFKDQTTVHNQDTPVWRLVIIHEPFGLHKQDVSHFIVCFVFHHAICDGTSGLAFHRHLVRKLVEVEHLDLSEANLESLTMVKSSDKSFLPSIEKLHPLPLSARFLLKSVWEEYVSSSDPHRWTGARISTDPSMRKSRYRSVHFSQEVTSHLRKACRSQSTTVTAAVQAILAAVLFASLPALSQTSDLSYSTLTSDGAMSFRRWLPTDMVDDDSIGNWVSRYVYDHRIPQRVGNPKKKKKEETSSAPIITANDVLELFSWEEARRIRETIQIEINKNGKDSVAGLLGFAGNFHKFFKAKIGEPRGESFEFSNIGVFRDTKSAQSDSAWSIGKVVFSQSADVVGAAIETSLVTGGDGCLIVGFSWLDGVVQSSVMEDQVMFQFANLLETVASTSVSSSPT